MSDRYAIDSHKLHLHPARVAAWLEGGNIAPVYIEVSPSGACNHRCRFCALDFMGYKPRFLPVDPFCERLREMGAAGVRSIMYAGEGEPFLHRDMAKIAQKTKEAGIDVAFTTNGVLLRGDTARAILPVTSWIKVSCNAGSSETYARIHRTRPDDFGTMLRRLAEALEERERLGSSCVIGFQMILLPDNMAETISLANTVRDLGADYFVVKPYSQHPQSLTSEYAEVSYADCMEIAEELESLSTESFAGIFRRQAMQRWQNREKAYSRCLAMPFWSYVDARGEVWGCSMFLNDPRFAYGNILERSFDEIWSGEQRKQSLAWCSRSLNAAECRINCRMDAINHYLHALRNPDPYANFI